MNFSPSIYSQLKTRLRRKYSSRAQKLFRQMRQYKKSPLSAWVENNTDLLDEFSSINWFFLQQLEQFLFFMEQDLEDSGSDDSLSTVEDLVFERWNASEMADIFLKAINKRKSVSAASRETLKLYEQHLITLGRRHLLKEDRIKTFYRPFHSLGEKKVGSNVVRLLETTINLEGKQISLRTSSLKEMKTLSQRIEEALRVIKACSPGSWDRFTMFTEVIVPIKVEEFVSYSHQELPGHSMINLYHRDFVDLMDDLIHENGHHHLNYYLNLGKLIEEPLDAIYLSPWRRTLRPLRGIFHAYFTFFWAFQLFSDLISCKNINSVHSFTESEKEKMIFRAVEEFWMLEYAYEDLKWARRRGLINDTGWALVSEQRKVLQKMKKKVLLWEKALKKRRMEIRKLKDELKASAKRFKKS